MAINNTPTNQLRCGNIKATIWENAARRARSSQPPSLAAVQGSVEPVALRYLIRPQ